MRSAFEAWAQRDGHIVRRREDKPEEYLVYEAPSKFAGSDSPVKAVQPDEAAVRNRVLNEVLDAFSDLDEDTGIEGVLKVIQSLKKKQKATAEQA
jgi:hypothetical protein